MDNTLSRVYHALARPHCHRVTIRMSDNAGTQSATSSPEANRQPKGKSIHVKTALLLLKAFAKTYKKIDADFDAFVIFVTKYVDQYAEQYKQLQAFAENTRDIVSTNLKVLAEGKKCVLHYHNDTIDRIEFPQHLIAVIEEAYRTMRSSPDIPFPSEDSLAVTIPARMLTVIDVDNGLPDLLRDPDPDIKPIVRISFPSNLGSIIALSDEIPEGLLEDAIYKFKVYLSHGNNANYAQTRMRPGFAKNVNILKDMINSVMLKPGTMVAAVQESTDMNFRFFANLAGMITSEYKEKRDMLPVEKSYCQAARILSVLNIHYRESVKKNADQKKNTIGTLESQLRAAPYAYTLNDIYALKDTRGTPLITENSKEGLIKFIENKTRPKANEILPEIVRMKTSDAREYLIYKDLIPTLFVQTLFDISDEMQNHYSTSWLNAMWRNAEPEAMHDDDAFQKDLSALIRSYYPLFDAMLDYNLLSGVEKDITINYDLVPQYDRCLDRKNHRLKPLAEILRLDRKGLVKAVKSELPAWGKIRIFRKIGLLLAKLLKGKDRRVKAPTAGRPARKAATVGTAKKIFQSVSSQNAGAGDATKSGAASKGSPTKGSATKSGATKGGAASKGKSKKGASSAFDKQAVYKKALKALKEQFVGKDATIQQKLSSLTNKWNPLYQAEAKKNLITDVNSMVRDFIRGLRKGFQVKPPDANRVRALALKLSQNSVFDRIKKKEEFKRYIEVYIIQILGEK